MKTLYPLLLSLLLGLGLVQTALTQTVSQPITNGMLKSDATGLDSKSGSRFSWIQLNKVGIGNGTPATALHIFPSDTTTAGGIRFGADSPALTMHRSAANTLTLTGNLVVTGTINGSAGGVGTLLADNNAWTGTNTWSNTVTFNGTTVVGNAGLSFAGNGATNTRTALSLVPGTNVQVWDADLDTLAGLVKTSNYMMLANGSAWTSASPAAVKAALDLETGTDLQAYDADLVTIAGLAKTANNFMMANGSIWTLVTPATVKSNLDLEIGSDVQAWSTRLDTLAAMSSASPTIPTHTAGVWTELDQAGLKDFLGMAPGDSTALGASIVLDNSSLAAGSTTLLDSAGDDYTVRTPTTLDLITTWYLVTSDSNDGKLNAATRLTGITPVANGGTGKSSVTQDKILYTSAANTFAETAITAAGRGLIDDASTATMRATLDLEVGTDLQAYDADLTTIAGLSPGVGGAVMLHNGGGWTSGSKANVLDFLDLASTDAASFLTMAATEVTVTPGGAVVGYKLGAGTTYFAELEGSSDTYETTLAFVDPAGSDKTITFPNATGYVALVGSSTGTIAGSDISSGSPTFTAVTTSSLTGALSGNVIVVDNTHPNATNTRTALSKYDAFRPFLTIQAAINAAAANDVIDIRGAVSYSENLTVTNIPKLIFTSQVQKSISGLFVADNSYVVFHNTLLITNSATATVTLNNGSYVDLFDVSAVFNTGGPAFDVNSSSYVTVLDSGVFGTSASDVSIGSTFSAGFNSRVVGGLTGAGSAILGEGAMCDGGVGTTNVTYPSYGPSYFGSINTTAWTLRSGTTLATAEGSTDDTNETAFSFVDPTADRTITFPDLTGTVLLQSVASPTATTTLSSTVNLVSDVGGSGETYYMPLAASAKNQIYFIKNVDTADAIVINNNAGDAATFDTYDDFTLTKENDWVSLVSDGTNWKVLGSSIITGQLKFADTVWEDLRFPTNAINLPGAGTDPSRSNITGLLEFADGADATIAGSTQMPHGWKPGTAIRPHVHVLFPAAKVSTGVTRWKLEVNRGDYDTDFEVAYESYVTIGTISVTNPDNTKLTVLEGWGDVAMTNIGESGSVLWRISRMGNTDGLDVDTGKVVLLDVDFHYQVEKLGTDDELPPN